MHRLRHPIRSITEPFGKAGLTVAILALVLATTGAAFAAAGLNSKQKKEVTKIAKKYAGKPGAIGPPGAAGPAGPAGKTGKEGPEGKEGSPWTAGGTLPKGATETGSWGLHPAENEEPVVSISFPIRLSEPVDNAHVHVVFLSNAEACAEGSELPPPACEEKQAEIKSEFCTGSAKQPKAAEGNFCLYVGENLLGNVKNFVGHIYRPYELFAGGTGTAGAVAVPKGAAAPAVAWGTWAVTGK